MEFENQNVKNIKKFTNLIKHKLLKNVGHNVPQESLDFFKFYIRN